MIAWIRFGLTAAFVLAGIVVCCIGVLGVYRFKYVANRMHASALNDTLGIALCLIGWAISAPDGFTAVKLLLVVVFYFISGPVSSHLLCRLEIETNEQRADYMAVRDLDEETAIAAAQAKAQAELEAGEGEAMAQEDAPDEEKIITENMEENSTDEASITQDEADVQDEEVDAP